MAKEEYEKAFDTVAEFILALDNLPTGAIQLHVTGMDQAWWPFFRDALLRSLKTHNEQSREVFLV